MSLGKRAILPIAFLFTILLLPTFVQAQGEHTEVRDLHIQLMDDDGNAIQTRFWEIYEEGDEPTDFYVADYDEVDYITMDMWVNFDKDDATDPDEAKDKLDQELMLSHYDGDDNFLYSDNDFVDEATHMGDTDDYWIIAMSISIIDMPYFHEGDYLETLSRLDFEGSPFEQYEVEITAYDPLVENEIMETTIETFKDSERTNRWDLTEPQHLTIPGGIWDETDQFLDIGLEGIYADTPQEAEDNTRLTTEIEIKDDQDNIVETITDTDEEPAAFDHHNDWIILFAGNWEHTLVEDDYEVTITYEYEVDTSQYQTNWETYDTWEIVVEAEEGEHDYNLTDWTMSPTTIGEYDDVTFEGYVENTGDFDTEDLNLVAVLNGERRLIRDNVELTFGEQKFISEDIDVAMDPGTYDVEVEANIVPDNPLDTYFVGQLEVEPATIEPDMELHDWDMSPSQVYINDIVTVEGNVTNYGDSADATVSLWFDGVDGDEETVFVEETTTETISFQDTPDNWGLEEGQYYVDVAVWSEGTKQDEVHIGTLIVESTLVEILEPTDTTEYEILDFPIHVDTRVENIRYIDVCQIYGDNLVDQTPCKVEAEWDIGWWRDWFVPDALINWEEEACKVVHDYEQGTLVAIDTGVDVPDLPYEYRVEAADDEDFVRLVDADVHDVEYPDDFDVEVVDAFEGIIEIDSHWVTILPPSEALEENDNTLNFEYTYETSDPLEYEEGEEVPYVYCEAEWDTAPFNNLIVSFNHTESDVVVTLFEEEIRNIEDGVHTTRFKPERFREEWDEEDGFPWGEWEVRAIYAEFVTGEHYTSDWVTIEVLEPPMPDNIQEMIARQDKTFRQAWHDFEEPMPKEGRMFVGFIAMLVAFSLAGYYGGEVPGVVCGLLVGVMFDLLGWMPEVFTVFLILGTGAYVVRLVWKVISPFPR